MIRRNAPRRKTPYEWLLISQNDHAELSYRLACAWCAPRIYDLFPDTPHPTAEELLQAIRLHDRGWGSWDGSPGLDPDHGRPYSFTEMPPADAQAIWTRSIDACGAVGPLAGWSVASHFLALHDNSDGPDAPLWHEWLARENQRRDRWLRGWLARDSRHTQPQAEHCLSLLQTFDWLSLWLCCVAPLGECDPEEQLELTSGAPGFAPVGFVGAAGGVRATPWPFDQPALELAVPALRVPVRRYADTRALLQAATPTTAAWRLTRG